MRSSVVREKHGGAVARDLRNILIAGAGELGRTVADKFIDHQEMGFRVAGFLDDRLRGEFTGHRGIPILGGLG